MLCDLDNPCDLLKPCAFVKVPASGDSLTGALATLAFLVVFRVLIKLFFSMDMVVVRLSLEFCLPPTHLDDARGMPNRMSCGRSEPSLKRKRLVPKYYPAILDQLVKNPGSVKT